MSFEISRWYVITCLMEKLWEKGSVPKPQGLRFTVQTRTHVEGVSGYMILLSHRSIRWLSTNRHIEEIHTASHPQIWNQENSEWHAGEIRAQL